MFESLARAYPESPDYDPSSDASADLATLAASPRRDLLLADLAHALYGHDNLRAAAFHAWLDRETRAAQQHHVGIP